MQQKNTPDRRGFVLVGVGWVGWVGRAVSGLFAVVCGWIGRGESTNNGGSRHERSTTMSTSTRTTTAARVTALEAEIARLTELVEGRARKAAPKAPARKAAPK